MATSIVRSSRLMLALAATIAMLALGLIAGQEQAKAGWSNYCNGVTLGGGQGCTDFARYMNQVYGWGDQRSVCVGISGAQWSWRCSSGPGAGVYSPTFGPGTFYPGISNNAAGANTVHGVALSP
jgi:hypothetical protein